MKTLLLEVLTTQEQAVIMESKFIFTSVLINKPLIDVTVSELSQIGLVVIGTEYHGFVPECFIAAETLRILMTRAKEKNISIF